MALRPKIGPLDRFCRRRRPAKCPASIALRALIAQNSPPGCFAGLGRTRSNLLDALDAGDEMAEQVLDAGLEGGRRGRAAGAGAAHVEENLAVLESLEGDVAAIHRHRRADAGCDQL